MRRIEYDCGAQRMQKHKIRWKQWLAAMAVSALAACAAAPAKTPEPSKAVFYPPLPNPPRIQHLTTIASDRDISEPAGGFARFIAGDDSNAQRLRQPYGVAMYDGKMYVADSRAPGLAVFDLRQRRFTLIPGAGNGRMKRPINVTIDSDGTKYVTDTGRDQVLIFDRGDRFVSAYGTEGQFKPVDTAIAGDRLYVVDIKHHQVQVLDKRTGKLLFRFGEPGSKAGELFHPTNIAIGPDGDVYVVETSNFRVQRFTAEGKPVRIYGEAGAEFGTFSRPKGIAIDRAGRLYVGDAAFENVQIFETNGRLLLYFGQPGERAEGLNLPAGVTIDYDNVEYFRRYADPGFAIEYVILVASQFGPNKVDVFGFGRMRGMDYPADAKPAPPGRGAR
jgi:DNA-binding beta-propeller fold protein YncE